MTQKKFCDNIFDIISVLTHERQHLLDAVLFGLKVYESWGGEEFREWHAYTTQVIYNPYWIFTTPVFQVHIMNTYGQYIDNIIKGMGGK